MKRKILIHVCALILLLTSSVYAQEVPTDGVAPDPTVVIPIPDVVIPDPNVVIPADTQGYFYFDESKYVEQGIQERSSTESTPKETEEITGDSSQEQVEELIQEEVQLQSFEMLSDEERFIAETIVSASTTASSTDSSVASTTSIVSTSTVRLFIRNGENLIFEGDVPFVEGETIKIKDISDFEHEVSSESPLAILLTADLISEDFNIPPLTYYSSMGLLLDCLEISSETICYDYNNYVGWNYAINGSYPTKSIDQSSIKNTDRVGLMFGKTYQIVFDEEEKFSNTPFNVYTQKYDYETNTWGIQTGDTVGILKDSYTVIATSSVDIQGKTSFVITNSGDYSVGIERNDPDWGIYYDSISYFSVSATSTATSTDTTGGGSNKKEFDFDKALKFMGQDNSYGGSGLSSWVAIAFSSYGKEDSSLRNYVKSTTKLSNDLLSNERQAMAILALGENPYNFKGINFVEAIIKKFDGTQFGELSQINDDIFALLVLSKVGYTLEDIEIQKTVKFLKTKQGNDGIWDNNDLTGAAIQALRPFVGDKDASILNSKKQLQKNSWWESVSSTSWVAMAMYDLGENWTKGGKTAKDYFLDLKQQDNGSLTEGGNDLMTTAYAIPAMLGKSWNDILNSVSRPTQTSGGASGGVSTDTIATSTVSTTTEIIPLTEEVVEEAATSTIAAVTLDFTEDSLDTIEGTENSFDESSSTSSIQTTDIKQDQKRVPVWSVWFEKMSGYISGIFKWLFS